MENTIKPKDQLTEQKFQEQNSANAIRHAVDVKALFELYAYRIVDPSQFNTKMDALVKSYIQTSKDIDLKHKQ